MRRVLFCIFTIIFISQCVVSARADNDAIESESLESKIARAEILEEQVMHVNAELLRCKNSKTNWKTATIIGSVGTVATGTGAIIQTVKINKAKKEGKTEKKEGADNTDEQK